MARNIPLTRRQFVGATAAGAAAACLSGRVPVMAQHSPAPFTLPSLPYSYDALEPHLDAMTMEIHHNKHHQAYVNNLNEAVQGTEWATLPIEKLISRLPELPEEIRTKVQNNGGGHANHTLFWTIMGPDGGGEPQDALVRMLNRDFGGYAPFKEQFVNAAMTRFGSGWAWLSITPEKRLVVESTPNQDSPLMTGHIPILGVDVWEHAYYLKFQNRRAEYIDAFFNVIRWHAVQRRMNAALGT